ncbi:MAG TPA: hypothetical protein VGE47_10300 [Burkholderiaceae bacterium]
MNPFLKTAPRHREAQLVRCATAGAMLCLLAACANSGFDAGRTETVLPLSRAWVDGRQVEYISTDISDASMAQAAGLNYVPRLRDAIVARPSVLERVYKFPHAEQLSIFQSAPRPVGAANSDRNYSPLWRLVMVTWKTPEQAHELRSEEALLAAEEKGELTLDVTDIVVNCPVTRTVGGAALPRVR